MSRRNLGGFIRPGYNPLRVANAPTIGTATDSKTDGSVSVAFTAPSCVGGGAITGYTAVANCGSKFASGSSSPITVTGLTNCTAYTFKVYANNAFGPSAYSAASNSVTPTKTVIGQQAYTTAGTYSWVAPAGVTSVSVVAVGGGGAGWAGGSGGGGGALAYSNAISVTPGSSYAVVVGAGGASLGAKGSESSFTTVVRAGGGAAGTCSGATASGGTVLAGTGGAGGKSSGTNTGGGGAGGYSGAGGDYSAGAGQNGSGGGGGGGGFYCSGTATSAGGGGGVGLLGQGASGAGGGAGGGKGGGGGSGGSAGSNGYSPSVPSGNSAGGAYGGGGGSRTYGAAGGASVGGSGAVRIIWPGTTRQFPSTCTGDK